MNLKTFSSAIQADPPRIRHQSTQPVNLSLQATAVDLLQFMISRSELDRRTMDQLESQIIAKLFLSVHLKANNIQTKLLQVLHTIILANIGVFNSYSERPFESDAPETALQLGAVNSAPRLTALMLQTIKDGLNGSCNLPNFQYWLDFVSAAIPLYVPPDVTQILSLVETLCSQIQFSEGQVDGDRIGSASCCKSTTAMRYSS